MEGKLIAVRLEQKHMQILESIGNATGWNQSEVIRQLIENAKVAPAAVNVLVGGLAKKADALFVPN
jgi:hypothetical protein